MTVSYIMKTSNDHTGGKIIPECHTIISFVHQRFDLAEVHAGQQGTVIRDQLCSALIGWRREAIRPKTQNEMLNSNFKVILPSPS